MNAWDAVLWKARTDPDAPEGAEFWQVNQAQEPAPFYEVRICNVRFVAGMPIEESMGRPGDCEICLTRSGYAGATGREYAYCYAWSRAARVILMWIGTPEEYDYYMQRHAERASAGL